MGMIKYALLTLISLALPCLGRFGEAPYSLTLEGETLPLERGEEITVGSAELRVSIPLFIKNGNVSAFTLSHEQLYLDSGDLLPFEQLTESRIGLFTLTHLWEHWRAITITNLSSSREDGVSLEDALTVSGIYGVWFTGWKNLLIGPGVGFSTELEDGASFFPLIFLDWEFSSGWHLTTRPTPGTRFGPGLSLTYQPESRWAVYAGARYLSREYQLEEGIYDFQTTRLFSSLQYDLNENLTLSGTVGVNLGGELEINGLRRDLDTGFFGGIDLSWQF